MVFNDKTIFANRYKFFQRIDLSENIESWKAEDIKVKSLVTIRFSAQVNSAVSNALLLKEYLLLTQIRHNRLLSPLHYDEWETIPYIVYPYSDSNELKKRIQLEQLFSEIEAKKIFVAVAEGLQVLHQEGILHRNIHAGNVFLLNHEFVLGQFKRQNDFFKEHQQEVLPYSAPELFSEQPEYTEKSDIFSLAVLVYYVSTAIMPWQGIGGMALLKGAFIPNLPSLFSVEFNMLLKQCLSLKAEDRPTIETLLSILKADNNTIQKSASDNKETTIEAPADIKPLVGFSVNAESKIAEDKEDIVVVKQKNIKPKRSYFIPAVSGIAALLLLAFFLWKFSIINSNTHKAEKPIASQKVEIKTEIVKETIVTDTTSYSENYNDESNTITLQLESIKSDSNKIKKKKVYLKPFVNEQGLYGYKTWGNRVKIDPIYNDVFEFSENLAAVNYKGKWGFIDTKGSIVIQPQYTSATSFKNNIARVEKDGSVFSINKSGGCVNGCVVISQQNL
jgi:serine/threonine protein kinase